MYLVVEKVLTPGYISTKKEKQTFFFLVKTRETVLIFPQLKALGVGISLEIH